MLPQILGQVLPAAYQDLIKSIRDKYEIPDDPDQDLLPQFLAEEIPLEDIRQEIYNALKAQLPYNTPLAFILQPLQTLPSELPLREALATLAAALPDNLTVGNTIHKHLDSLFEPHIQNLTNQLFEYTLTGEASTLPANMFGGVTVIPVPNHPFVVALATEISDQKEIAQQFRRKMRETFGDTLPDFTPSDVKAAGNWRLKLEGYKPRDIADKYILDHPSEFSKDTRSPEFRAAKEKLQERIKKQIDRLLQRLEEWGDTFTP